MDNHPMGWPLLYEAPLGMICLYGKVMFNATTDTDKQVGAKTLAKNYAIAHDALLAFIGRKKHLSRPLLPTKEP